MSSLALVIGLPLPPEAVACLRRNGFLSFPPLAPAPPPTPLADGTVAFRPLSPMQGQICAALTRQPLNERQAALLAIYWRAHRAGEEALSIDEAGRRLGIALSLDPEPAVGYVRGALRSFGRRLLRHLGAAGADEIPLLAMLAIETGPTGEARHRLTDDAAAAVAAALGLDAAGRTAETPPGVAGDDPEAMVALGMSRASAALLLRVQRTLGLGLDATVKALAAQVGAG